MSKSEAAASVEIEETYKEELRRSFELIKPISVEAAAIFYPTLWELNPATKVLFKNTDMVKQGEKLMKVLGVAVSSLRNFKALTPVMQRLGRKHITYGVTADMYPNVVSALLITLEKGLGDECTPLTIAAWKRIMEVISAVCIAAAKEEDPTYGEPAGEAGGEGEEGAAGAAPPEDGDEEGQRKADQDK